MLFCVPYFRRNSLNSRAGLEFEEFWLFSTIIFQKNVEIQCFFLILMGFAFSTMIFRKEKHMCLFKCVAYICKCFSDWWNQFFLATIQTLKSGAYGGPFLKIHRKYFVEQLPAKK